MEIFYRVVVFFCLTPLSCIRGSPEPRRSRSPAAAATPPLPECTFYPATNESSPVASGGVSGHRFSM